MPNPQDASRPSARSSKTNEERKAPNLTWVRPEKPEPQSGMLQNRKLDLHKGSRPQKTARR